MRAAQPHIAAVDMTVDEMVRVAIAQRRLLRFQLYGRLRVVEPHDYGVRRGEAYLLGYQVAGDSRSGGLPEWRWVRLRELHDMSLLDATFAGGRPAGTHGHSVWDELYARVGDPAPAGSALGGETPPRIG